MILALIEYDRGILSPYSLQLLTYINELAVGESKPVKAIVIGQDVHTLTSELSKYSPDEIKILKKISEWPKCVDIASKKLEPHRIAVYLYELASDFHSYWNMGKDNEELRFINKDKKILDSKLVFLKVTSNVIKSGMNIIGVNTPEKM